MRRRSFAQCAANQLCRLLHSDTCKWHWHYFTTKYAMAFLAARGRKTIIGDRCGQPAIRAGMRDVYRAIEGVGSASLARRLSKAIILPSI